jgi:hypothetical protein
LPSNWRKISVTPELIDKGDKAMDCKEFEDKIPEYLEKTLDAYTERLMAEHRRSCRDCACALKIHEYVFITLNNTECVKAPAGLAEKILAAVETDKVSARVKWFPKYSAYISLTAAFVFAGLGLFNLIIFILAQPGVRTAANKLYSALVNTPDWSIIVQGWVSSLQTSLWQIAPFQDIYRTLSTTIQIPYFSYNVPVYFLGAYAVTIMFLTFSVWVYFRDPLSA